MTILRVAILMIIFLFPQFCQESSCLAASLNISTLFSRSKPETLERLGKKVKIPPAETERIYKRFPHTLGKPALAKGAYAMEQYVEKMPQRQTKFINAAPDPAAVLDFYTTPKGVSIMDLGSRAADLLGTAKIPAAELAKLPAGAKSAFAKLGGNYGATVTQYMEFIKTNGSRALVTINKLMSQITPGRVTLAYLAWYLIDPQGASEKVEEIINERVVPALTDPVEKSLDALGEAADRILDKSNEKVENFISKSFGSRLPLTLFCIAILLLIWLFFKGGGTFFKRMLSFSNTTGTPPTSQTNTSEKPSQLRHFDDINSRKAWRSPFRPR